MSHQNTHRWGLSGHFSEWQFFIPPRTEHNRKGSQGQSYHRVFDDDPGRKRALNYSKIGSYFYSFSAIIFGYDIILLTTVTAEIW